VLYTIIIVQLLFFWVVGNASVNSVLITDYLSTNHHNGDRLRRVFPLSAFDYSIELTINRDIRERAYSCVIDGATDVETTLFIYIVRSIDLGGISNRTEKAHKNETTIITTTNESEIETSTIEPEKIVAHDALTPQQIGELRQKISKEHTKKKHKKLKADDDDDDLLDFSAREESSKTR